MLQITDLSWINPISFENYLHPSRCYCWDPRHLKIYKRYMKKLNLISVCRLFFYATKNRTLHAISFAKTSFFFTPHTFCIHNSKRKTVKILFCLILNSQHFSWWDICKNWDSLDVAYLEIPIENITTWHTLSTLLSVYERDPPVGKMDFWCFLCR